MQKITIAASRGVALVEAPDPEPHDDWVVVKIHAAPLCTEYKNYVGGRPDEFPGHEAAGEVVAVAQPGRVRVGDRVVVMPQFACGTCALCVAGDYIYCQNNSRTRAGTLAQYICKPDWLLPAIPDGLTYERAALACCGLGPTFGAFERAGLSAYDTVLITGAGPVGLGAVVNARFRGARVIVVESAAWRAERARQMGAIAVVDPRSPDAVADIRALTDGRGVDVAVECAGAVPAQRLCIDATRRRGTVAFVGQCSDELAIRVSPDVISKGLTIMGAWHYRLQDYPRIAQTIEESPLIDLLISHVLPMRDAAEAFALQAAGECAKVILQPWG
jgi:threonine dehydrogenase-like Zn-dependent dehydrogenase